MATRDVEIGGYPVEAGTMLAYGRLAVQRDPTLWEEPLTFDPDRQLLRSLRVIVDVRNGVRR
jgi:cytochrome P450